MNARLREGHSVERAENGTVFTLTCKCGWHVTGLIAVPDGADQMAYEHITGDVADTGNMARLRSAGLWIPGE